MFRDIYYIATVRTRRSRDVRLLLVPPLFNRAISSNSSPIRGQWSAFADNNMAKVEFRLKQDDSDPKNDQFFVLGDNSAKSQRQPALGQPNTASTASC